MAAKRGSTGRRPGLRLLALTAVLLLVASVAIEASASLLHMGSRAYADDGTGHRGAGGGHGVSRHSVSGHGAVGGHTPAGTGGPAPGAGPLAPPGWRVSTVSVDFRGEDRYYLLARPDRVTAEHLPLLVVLAGRDMSPARIERSSGFLGLVGQAVVVYPDGYRESWNAGYCCGAAHRADVDDVAFVEKVIRSVLASQPGTSARQVYLAGFSNGGRMAYLMACDDPGAFAGVAAVEAVAVSTCRRTAPVPLLEIAQTGDPLLTIPTGSPPKHIAGHAEITVDALTAHWRDLEHCAGPPSVVSYGIRELTVDSWTSCSQPGRVALAVYRGGAHRWPPGAAGVPSAEELIWSFFDRHRLPPATYWEPRPSRSMARPAA